MVYMLSHEHYRSHLRCTNAMSRITHVIIAVKIALLVDEGILGIVVGQISPFLSAFQAIAIEGRSSVLLEAYLHILTLMGC